MTRGTELELQGESKLTSALTRAALRCGCAITSSARSPGTGETRLARRRDGVTVAAVPVVPDENLPTAIAEDALRRIMRAVPSQGISSAVVLAPAGGVTGPANGGPVDALVLGGNWVIDEAGAQCTARLLAVQQTRCWVAVYSWDEVPGGSPDPGVERVPSWIASDTARVCEYVHDRWPSGDKGLYLLGEPWRGPGHRAEAMFSFDEAGYAGALVGSLLAKEEDV